MKKLLFSLLLGSSLLFSVNQSYGAEKVIDRFHPWFDYIKNLVKEMYKIDISKAKFPDTPSNQKFQGAIKGDGQNWSICYWVLKHNDLDAIEKKVFERLNFDKNDFVHILAFDGIYEIYNNGRYSHTLPKPGYFFQGLSTHYLTWSVNHPSGFYYSNLCEGMWYDKALGRFYINGNQLTLH